MLERGIIDELGAARSNDSCTFVVEWRAQPDQALFDDAPSKRERLTRLIQFYSTVKGPLLEQLMRRGVEVTDIPTSPQAIVTASARDWRHLATELADEEDVRVLPNRLFTTV